MIIYTLLYIFCVFVLFFLSHSDIALRIEDYEEYFKQKHADSNCGFAEEYEVWETQICICLFFYLYTSSYDNIIKQFYSGLVTEMYLETSVFKI